MGAIRLLILMNQGVFQKQKPFGWIDFGLEYIHALEPRGCLCIINNNDHNHNNGNDMTPKSIRALALILIVCLVSVFMVFFVFGSLQIMNSNRQDRNQDDTQQLLDRLAVLKQSLQPLGFTVEKNVTQVVAQATAVIVGGWSALVGMPAYDDSMGAFNLTSGIFVAPVSAKYLAETSLVWLAGAGGTRTVAIVTNGLNLMRADHTYFYFAAGIATNRAMLVVDLAVGDSVWIEASHGSVGIRTIAVTSRLSVERIAVG